MARIYLATTNPGKLRELNEAAHSLGVDLEAFAGMKTLPPAIEDGTTFEQNARIKAEYYSRFVPSELVLAEDSGLSVDELAGAPGVHSARYAAMLQASRSGMNRATHNNSDDEENNRALIVQLKSLPAGNHAGKYICVMEVAPRGAERVTTVRGERQAE